MAVHLFCSKCKTSNGLDAMQCSCCGVRFGRHRKYRVCVSFKGSRVTQVVENLTLARETEVAIKADFLRGKLDISKLSRPPTLNEVWIKYLPWAKEHKKTWVDDKYNYNKHLKPRFGKKSLERISSFDIERMKVELNRGVNRNGKPYSKATIKHQLVLLKRLFTLSKRWGLYDGSNPFESVEMPKLNNRVTEFMTDEQVEGLLNVLEVWPNIESAAFVKFALFTGLRRGELFKLTWDDVDYERGAVRLRNPKGGRTEIVPVSEQALEVLEGLKRSSVFVFPGKNGRQRTDFKGPWQRIRESAGLPSNFRFHGLRHHFASTLVSNGEDLFTVQKLLTHKDSRSTQRYAHLADKTLRNAANRSGVLLSPKERPSANNTQSVKPH